MLLNEYGKSLLTLSQAAVDCCDEIRVSAKSFLSALKSGEGRENSGGTLQ